MRKLSTSPKRRAVQKLIRKFPEYPRKVIVSHDPCPSCKKVGGLVFFTLSIGTGAYCAGCSFMNACGAYEHKHEVEL